MGIEPTSTLIDNQAATPVAFGGMCCLLRRRDLVAPTERGAHGRRYERCGRPVNPPRTNKERED
jgi:hypothetical protein